MVLRNSLLGVDVAEHVQLLLVFSAHAFFLSVRTVETRVTLGAESDALLSGRFAVTRFPCYERSRTRPKESVQNRQFPEVDGGEVLGRNRKHRKGNDGPCYSRPECGVRGGYGVSLSPNKPECEQVRDKDDDTYKNGRHKFANG